MQDPNIPVRRYREIPWELLISRETEGDKASPWNFPLTWGVCTMGSEALGKGLLGNIWDYLGCWEGFVTLDISSGVFQKSLSHVHSDTEPFRGGFLLWVRATCSKKWLFGGSLSCGAVLGTNCHAWLCDRKACMNSKEMGKEVSPAVCWDLSLGPSPLQPQPQGTVPCEVGDPRLSLPPLQETPNTAPATEASLQGIVC